MRPRTLRPSALELLALLLAGAIVATYAKPQYFRPRKNPTTTALADLNAIGAALETYRFDSDSFPTTTQVLAALVREPSAPPHPWNWRGPYFLSAIPRDPWDHAYVYQRDESLDGYLLMSLGADGRLGGAVDSADVVRP